jgi:TorA maturation chaperone TorD
MASSMVEDLREERDVLNLLKHLFLKEATSDFLRELGAINTAANESDTDGRLDMIICSLRANKDRLDEYVQDLAVEFARLFVGPKNPPAVPYASFYLSRSRNVMTEVTSDVRKRYLDAGMAVKNLYSTPDDHIGIELEFISYLTEKIIDLHENGQSSEGSRLFEIRNNFIKEHMSLWVPLLASKIQEAAEEDFYKGAAIVLGDVMENLTC